MSKNLSHEKLREHFKAARKEEQRLKRLDEYRASLVAKGLIYDTPHDLISEIINVLSNYEFPTQGTFKLSVEHGSKPGELKYLLVFTND